MHRIERNLKPGEYATLSPCFQTEKLCLQGEVAFKTESRLLSNFIHTIKILKSRLDLKRSMKACNTENTPHWH